MRVVSTKSEADYQRLLDRLSDGDAAARDELIARSVHRLRVVARLQLHRFPRIRRLEQTEDVLQYASIRLIKSLEQVRPPNVRAFFGLASEHMRRVLIDLYRHYFGPEGMGTFHATPRPDEHSRNREPGRVDAAGGGPDPAQLSELAELHEQVARLNPTLRQVVDLIWYQGLARRQAAELLGISERHVGRLWREAKIALADLLDDPAD